MSKLPAAYEWRQRDIDDWNATTFRAYLSYAHEQRLGLPYVSNNIAAEQRNIKRMYDEHGKEVLKDFIDECLRQFKPTANYPALNFFFMYSYMREKVLPTVLRKNKLAKLEQEASHETADDFFDYI